MLNLRNISAVLRRRMRDVIYRKDSSETSDETSDLIAPLEQIIFSVYESRLARAPSADEVADWIASIKTHRVSLDGFRAAVDASTEAEALMEAMRYVISQIYRLAFGREALPEELDHWRQILRSRQMTFLAITQALLSSSEAKAHVERGYQDLEQAVSHVYRAFLSRVAQSNEIEEWAGHVRSGAVSVATMVNSIAQSDEAKRRHSGATMYPLVSDAEFIQHVYGKVLRRSAMPQEIAFWSDQLEQDPLEREKLVLDIFRAAGPPSSGNVVHQQHDPSQSYILGTEKTVTADEWSRVGIKLRSAPPPIDSSVDWARFQILEKHSPLITVATSLYKGSRFISRFLENITSQSVFRECVELVIVDANSPDGEAEIIKGYQKEYPNIIYHRTEDRIGIYEAWNLCIEISEGKYITNANLDDLRRHDSLELQAATLDNANFADVVYQDFYYTFDYDLSFEEIIAHGFKSSVPIITPYNLLRFNSPHNAPMWRRTLHREVGPFDARYASAGDWDFWLRCSAAGKQFFKINDPHVAYFINPAGISTRPDTRGIDEANDILMRRAPELVSSALLCSPEQFLADVARRSGQDEVYREKSRHIDWRYRTVQRSLRAASALLRDGYRESVEARS